MGVAVITGSTKGMVCRGQSMGAVSLLPAKWSIRINMRISGSTGTDFFCHAQKETKPLDLYA